MSVDSNETSAFDGKPERLFLFTRAAVKWGYVNQSQETVYNSVEYVPMMIEMDDISQALSEDSPTVDIVTDADNPVVQQFVPYQPINPLRVRVFRHHADDVDDDYKVEMIGEVVSVQFDEEAGTANISVRMLYSNMDRKVPWPVYQKPCNYALYGPGCRVNPDPYTTTTTVSAHIENRIYSDDFAERAALEDDPVWYINGWAQVVRTGERRFIIYQEDNVLHLQAPFVDLVNGEEVIAVAGCDRSRQTCRDKFDNLDRYFGFPWPPEKNPFTDNVYGTGAAGGMNARQELAANAAALRELGGG